MVNNGEWELLEYDCALELCRNVETMFLKIDVDYDSTLIELTERVEEDK